MKDFVTLLFTIISDYFAQDGWTPLHLAASKGHQEVCQRLIEHSARVDAQTKVRTRHHLDFAYLSDAFSNRNLLENGA